MADIASRFLYDRSVQRDVAAVLADMRAYFPHDHHVIDGLSKHLLDLFADDPNFDVDDWCRRARYRYDG